MVSRLDYDQVESSERKLDDSFAKRSQNPTIEGEVSQLELTVVMPCLNEERTLGICIHKALKAMQEYGISGEVLIVDNGSSDSSIEIAEKAGARVVYHPLKGYGNALRRGFREAKGRFVIMGDADDSYDFADIQKFVEALRAGSDLVMGNRLKGEIKPGAMPWLHRYVGNPGMSWFVNYIFNTPAGDCHCGMRGLRRDAIPHMNLQMPGMEFASEMLIKANKAGLKISEVPITLKPDGRDRPPHLRTFRDGWRHLRFLLMCSASTLFMAPGVFLFLVGLLTIPVILLTGYGNSDDILGPNFLFTAASCALTGGHIILFGLLAKIHSHLTDSVFYDLRIERFLNWFRLERGLLIGMVFWVLSALLGLPVLIHWIQTFQVPNPGHWIAAGTLFLLGIETTFVSFLISVIDLRREKNRCG